MKTEKPKRNKSVKQQIKELDKDRGAKGDDANLERVHDAYKKHVSEVYKIPGKHCGDSCEVSVCSCGKIVSLTLDDDDGPFDLGDARTEYLAWLLIFLPNKISQAVSRDLRKKHPDGYLEILNMNVSHLLSHKDSFYDSKKDDEG